MRCASCDEVLTFSEASRRSLLTGKYFDLCDHCFETIDDQVVAIKNPNVSDDDEEQEDE